MLVDEEGPPVLLVHNFGALLEHYHDKICKIANDGNILWAIAILGFGRLEKLTVVYNELLWAKLLRDFTVEVVREPVHICGKFNWWYIFLHYTSCI